MLDIIESNYQVLSNGLYHQVNQLTLTHISKSFNFNKIMFIKKIFYEKSLAKVKKKF